MGHRNSVVEFAWTIVRMIERRRPVQSDRAGELLQAIYKKAYNKEY